MRFPLVLAMSWALTLPCSGQATQAYLNTVADIQETQVDEILAVVTLNRAAVEEGRALTDAARANLSGAGLTRSGLSLAEANVDRVEEAYDRLATALEDIAAASDDPGELHAALVRYALAQAQLVAAKENLDPVNQSWVGVGVAPALTPVPGYSTLSSSVVFAIGAGISTTYADPDGDVAGSLGVSSNLLGKLAGAPLTALGADGLGQYINDNISVGASVPFNGAEGLSGDLGVGLGEIDFGRISLWPVLGITQVGAGDGRVPDAVAETDPEASAWSAPSLSVAVLPFKKEDIEPV